jgi:zinc D-Ala-D-Ala carboxypeptidase
LRRTYLTLCLLLAGCIPVAGASPTAPAAVANVAVSPAAVPGPTLPAPTPATATRVTASPPPSPTPLPTGTPAATPTATASPTRTPIPTPIPACRERHPAPDDLLALINHDYGLSADYKPDDLVALGDYFPSAVTRGYPTQVRAVIIGPLEELIAAMHAAELRPFVVSGFRGYYDQSLARQKWAEEFPEWVHNISARPGHSEHQLGTTLDFSTPDLPAMVGETFIEFHPAFAVSGEGQWLAAHAHEYGFTMSYPDDRYEATGFNYEPWHFRYVGVALATELYEKQVTISEYLLETYGPPCVP